MYFDFANVLVYLAISVVFITVSLTAGWVLRPNRPTPEKLSTYECGEDAIGSAWIQFNVRFYIIALIFLIFDVEVAFTFPVGVVFRRWVQSGKGGIAFLEILVFVAILALALAYVWRKGDLEWVRPVIKDENEPGSDP